jgi:glycosyltransferase involved in cell wall biosynthesis
LSARNIGRRPADRRLGDEGIAGIVTATMTAEPDPPMRLAYLGDPNEVHTRRWLTFFVERGHDVHLLVRSDTVLESPLPAGIVLERMDPFEIRWYRPDSYMAARRAVRRTLERIGAEVLHVHYLTGYGFWAWLSGFRPYVITVWGSDVFRTLPTSRRHRLYGRLALRGAAAVTADSIDLAGGSIAAGARQDRTTVVQFGVDTARFTPLPRDSSLAARIGSGTPRLVFSPRVIFPWNRHEDVIRAVAEMPADVGLLLSALHADPAYLASLIDLARSVGIADRMTVLDGIPHAEMADHLRLADVVVSVPETDGTPVTILESLACGVPVVASDVPSVREWLAGFSPELLVPIADQAATTEAIRHVLGLTAEQAAALRAAGRQLVVERGDHATHMLGVEATYRRLAGATARRGGGRAARVAP